MRSVARDLTPTAGGAWLVPTGADTIVQVEVHDSSFSAESLVLQLAANQWWAKAVVVVGSGGPW